VSRAKAGAVASLEPELAAPVEILEPASLSSPLVLSSPHSGAIYPQAFLRMSRLSAATLRRSEDAFVDALFASGLTLGAPLVRALFPRAYLDVNREPYELDPRMFSGALPAQANTRSLRVVGGLGVIPRIVGESQEIYAERLPVAAALNRIDALYRPYHAALREQITAAQSRFGQAVLIDCHSMPSMTVNAGRLTPIGADIVLGDRFGAACAPALTQAAEQAFRMAGLMVLRNRPYAGGFITEHYGAPAARAHALQIEVNRALYMDETRLEPNAGFEDLCAIIGRALAAIDAAADELTQQRLAAE
jgi:N-formylglutamate amidohydrolase